MLIMCAKVVTRRIRFWILDDESSFSEWSLGQGRTLMVATKKIRSQKRQKSKTHNCKFLGDSAAPRGTDMGQPSVTIIPIPWDTWSVQGNGQIGAKASPLFLCAKNPATLGSVIMTMLLGYALRTQLTSIA